MALKHFYLIMILSGDTTACTEINLSGDTEDRGNNLPGETVNISTLNNFHQLIKVAPKCWYQYTFFQNGRHFRILLFTCN